MKTGYTFTSNGIVNGDVGDAFLPKELFSVGGLWASGVAWLGDGTIISRSSPVQINVGGTTWRSVSTVSGATLAISSDGAFYKWGSAVDSNFLTSSSPAQLFAGNVWRVAEIGTNGFVLDSSGKVWGFGPSWASEIPGDATPSTPIEVFPGKSAKQIATGSGSNAATPKTSILMLSADGKIFGRGFNQYGALGDNSVAARSATVQEATGATDWKQISCGSDHAGAIKTNGTLWLWGSDQYGQLGTLGTTYYSTPVQLGVETTWKQLSCGSDHNAAIKTDGTLWVWGYNSNGQLGDLSTVTVETPVQTIAGGSNWKFVSAGGINTAAIKTDGTLWVWGNNASGQLGDNTTVAKSSPIQVGVGANWRTVSVSKVRSAGTTGSIFAINTDGDVL